MSQGLEEEMMSGLKVVGINVCENLDCWWHYRVWVRDYIFAMVIIMVISHLSNVKFYGLPFIIFHM